MSSPKTTMCSSGVPDWQVMIGVPLSTEASKTLAPQSFVTKTTSSGVSITLIGLITAPKRKTA